MAPRFLAASIHLCHSQMDLSVQLLKLVWEKKSIVGEKYNRYLWKRIDVLGGSHEQASLEVSKEKPENIPVHISIHICCCMSARLIMSHLTQTVTLIQSSCLITILLLLITQ